MTSSNGNIFHVTGPLCGEFTGERWIPLTKASAAELWCFLSSAPEETSKQSIRRWFETPSPSLWRHQNVCWTPDDLVPDICALWGACQFVIVTFCLHASVLSYHPETEQKWLPFCRRYFKPERNLFSSNKINWYMFLRVGLTTYFHWFG